MFRAAIDVGLVAYARGRTRFLYRLGVMSSNGLRVAEFTVLAEVTLEERSASGMWKVCFGAMSANGLWVELAELAEPLRDCCSELVIVDDVSDVFVVVITDVAWSNP